MNSISKNFIFIGIVLIIIGLLYSFFPKFFSQLGRLPGDIIHKRDNFTFYFPVTTSILISVLLSIVFYFLRK